MAHAFQHQTEMTENSVREMPVTIRAAVIQGPLRTPESIVDATEAKHTDSLLEHTKKNEQASKEAFRSQMNYRGRVLVIEDNSIIQRVRAYQLRSLRFEPVIVTSKDDVIEHLKGRNIDLILIDLDNTDHSGMDIVASIRRFEIQESEPYSVPIVAVSSTAYRKECLARGVDELERKPLMIGDVKHILSRWYCGKAE